MPKQPRGQRISAPTQVLSEVRRNAKLAEVEDAPRVASRFSRETTVAELIEWWLDSVARHQVKPPKRPARRQGAKSDPLDAARAAREALSREHLGQPRSRGQRAALQVLITVRAMAVGAAGDAQRQLQSLIVSAPDHLRERFTGMTTHAIVTSASKLRNTSGRS
jgi:hypothetical protein